MPKAGFGLINSVCLPPNNTLTLIGIDTWEVSGPEEKHLLVWLVENVWTIMYLYSCMISPLNQERYSP